jgi:hypothetical protein
VSTQFPLQVLRPGAHEHWPRLQRWPAGQATPMQARSVHWRSKQTLPGSHGFAPQLVGRHCRCAQASPATQAVAQLPQ